MTFLKYWVPVILCAVLILTASAATFSASTTGGWLRMILGRDVPPIAHFTIRKLAHLVEYAVLAALATRAARYTLPWRRPIVLFSPILIAAAVAVTDESIQSRIPTRTGSVWDVVLDVAGATIGTAILARFYRRTER